MGQWGVFQEGTQSLLEPGERQMDFGQDTRHAQDEKPAFMGPIFRGCKQGRLADPGLAVDDQRRSASIDPVEQMIDQGHVLLSPL